MGILIKGMDEIPEDGAVLVVKHDNGKAYIKHACTYGYSMELVKLPAVRPDHVADISKKASISCGRENDLISRRAALKELAVYIHLIDKTMGKGTLTDDDCMESAKSVLGEDELPAVQPVNMVDAHAKNTPNSTSLGEKEGKPDLISRQTALDALARMMPRSYTPDGSHPADEEIFRAQEVFADCIEALEILPSAQPEQVCVATVTLTDDQVKGVVEKAKNAVISVIEPELHWIPCSERLPKEKQSVLVTDGSVVWVCDIISTDEGYKWEDSHGYWLDLDEWKAWRPLPEPYRGGEK